jgi:formylglycine-generating enzyme required for sulfatase activity
MTGTTGIVFALLPGGSVLLGSGNRPDGPQYDPRHLATEALHEVNLAPFFQARHELTQGQWARLATWAGVNGRPAAFAVGTDDYLGGTPTLAHPVEQVDWPTCTKLLTRHGMALPTEAQWEYGCRAGTTTPWCSGAEVRWLSRFANTADLTSAERKLAWPDASDSRDGHVIHAPVGSFAANAFGLFDMHGNVYEWCRDCDRDYGSEREGDGLRPDGDDPGADRSTRGGSYRNGVGSARSASRGHVAPSVISNMLGLRAVRQLD